MSSASSNRIAAVGDEILARESNYILFYLSGLNIMGPILNNEK